MTATSQPFPSLTAPLVDKNGCITLAWRPLMTTLYNRTGGPSGVSGTYALVNGSSSATFDVATAVTGTNATPLAQVQNLDATTLNSAESFATSAANNAASTAQSNAETFATNAANTAQTNAETFATTAANNAQANAQTYALQQIQQGIGAAPTSITVGASPFTYTASAVGHVLINGTVTGLSLIRGTTTIALPLTTPIVPVDNDDAVKVTYSSAPTMTWVPR